MERSVKILIICSILILACLFSAGCSDNADTGGSAPAVVETTATATAAPLYTAGDIAWSSASTSTGWLILSYDAATDSYTRAFINKNPDGTWGYRSSSSTENAKRSVMEKVYPIKVAHVTVSSVPTQVPTTQTTTVATTKATTSTTTTAATTTTAILIPKIAKIDPDSGKAGSSVTITITGSEFQGNATAPPTVVLKHSGQTSITGTSVVWDSATQLTCTFVIPNTSTIGTWDLVVTNLNGQSGTLKNYFEVHGADA